MRRLHRSSQVFLALLVFINGAPSQAAGPAAKSRLKERLIHDPEQIARGGLSQDDSPVPRIFFGAGLISHQPGRMSSSETGTLSGAGLLLPALSLQGRWPEDWFFGPDSVAFSASLSATPLPHHSLDGSTSTLIFAPAARVSKCLGDWDLGLGLAVMIYRVSGAGGVSVQRDGASSQSFVIPGGASNAVYTALDLGTGLSFWKMRADMDLFLSGLLSSRRSVDLVMAVSYGVL